MSKEAVGKNHYWAEILQAGYEITEDLYGGGDLPWDRFSSVILRAFWFAEVVVLKIESCTRPNLSFIA